MTMRIKAPPTAEQRERAKLTRQVRAATPEQRIAKREYDRRWRASYAERKKALEQNPARRAVRTDYLRRRRTRPQAALALLLSEAKYRAKKRGLDYSLSMGDVTMPEVCPVLGIAIMHGNPDCSHTARDCAPSLDRIDGRRGYVPGNVRIISWRANRLKNDATIAELESVLRYMKGEIP